MLLSEQSASPCVKCFRARRPRSCCRHARHPCGWRSGEPMPRERCRRQGCGVPPAPRGAAPTHPWGAKRRRGSARSRGAGKRAGLVHARFASAQRRRHTSCTPKPTGSGGGAGVRALHWHRHREPRGQTHGHSSVPRGGCPERFQGCICHLRSSVPLKPRPSPSLNLVSDARRAPSTGGGARGGLSELVKGAASSRGKDLPAAGQADGGSQG